MIHIRYCPKALSVTISGHAGSAAPGQDLICAAVSALALTLAENGRQPGLCRGSYIRILPGDTRIRFFPEPGKEQKARIVFEALCKGFALLAKQWPEYVAFKLKVES